MGGVTNLTHEHPSNLRQGAKSGINSDNISMVAFAKSGGDPSRLGGHQTRTTEYTSNIGNMTMQDGGTTAFDRATSVAGGALSFQVPAGSATPTVGGGDQSGHIMNYPYSYD